MGGSELLRLPGRGKEGDPQECIILWQPLAQASHSSLHLPSWVIISHCIFQLPAQRASESSPLAPERKGEVTHLYSLASRHLWS